LAVISILISAPIAILFNQVVVDMSDGDLTAGDISAWISAVGGILFMLVVITVTVWGNIHRIMKLNPVDYIATE
jgi:fumarate reductase subunit D